MGKIIKTAIGCECKDFKFALSRRVIRHYPDYRLGEFWIANRGATESRILYCPFCGSPLTPPEEVGDESI